MIQENFQDTESICSGNYQDIESNYSRKISHVPSQPAVIVSPQSMLSCDQRLPLDT